MENLRSATKDFVRRAVERSARAGATVTGAVAHPLSLLSVAVALILSGVACFVQDDRPVWLLGIGAALAVLGLAEIRRRAARDAFQGRAMRAPVETLASGDPRIPKILKVRGVGVGAADADRTTNPNGGN